MPDDDAANLPDPIADGEVVILEQPEGMLVGGDPDAVESYLQRLRESAGHAVHVIGVDKGSLGHATGLGVGIAAVLQQTGKFVQLHPDSIAAIRRGNLIPGTDGFFRMMTRSADNKFMQQLQWRPAALGPQQLTSIQMIGVQLALKAAISEVEDSVHRVEGKVETVLQLAKANRAGDVLGTGTIVNRKVAYLEKHGSLPDADWDAVAGLGPTLNVTVEQLRNHVTRVLESLDPSLAVQDRAEKLAAAVDNSLIGETLSLLVVAEESLYKWQRLRLARVEATQPEHLPQVIQDARDLLMHQTTEDGKLYQLAHRVIDEFAKTSAIDGFRFRSVKQLIRDRDKLQADLDAFAGARRHQLDVWTALEAPGVREAVDAALDLAKPTARRALAAAGRGLLNLSEYLTEKPEKKEPVEKKQPPTTETTETTE